MRPFLLVFVLLFVSACTPTWRDAVDASGSVAREIACAVCGPQHAPAPPQVDPDRASKEDAARLLAWSAAMIAILQNVVQRGAVEALAEPKPTAK